MVRDRGQLNHPYLSKVSKTETKPRFPDPPVPIKTGFMLCWRSCSADIKLFFCRGKKTWLKVQSVSEELQTLFSWELTPEVNPDQGLPLWHLTPHPQTCQEWQTRGWRQGCAGAGGEHEKSWQDWGGSGQTAEGNRATNRENSWALSPCGNLPRYCQSFWFFKKNKFIQWIFFFFFTVGLIFRDYWVCMHIYIYNPYVHELCSTHRHTGYVSWPLQHK